MKVHQYILAVLLVTLTIPNGGEYAYSGEVWDTIFPEQRDMKIREPSQMPRMRLPDVPTPPTVSQSYPENPTVNLSLDEAIRIALENTDVVRVLGGSSGRTIYDPAISNTAVDVARGRFDPAIRVDNAFDRDERPGAFLIPGPPRARFDGEGIDQYRMGLGLSKTTASGGTAGLNVNTDSFRSTADNQVLNPQAPTSVDLRFTQPLLQGGGTRANLVPIELARIDTERSFYQLKSSVQRLVSGVIEAYWALVSARTDVWARRRQVDQGKFIHGRAEAEMRVGRADGGDVAETQSALANFRANLVSSEANLLRRESVLRNLLGLAPYDGSELIPTTQPPTASVDVDWQTVLELAGQHRPNLIELRLAIEADQAQLFRAENQALPQVDATASYRWNSLGGRTLNGSLIVSDPGQFTGWQLGVDVTLPLGLRQSRAAMRQAELLLMRDRAQLRQASHDATHSLAESYRNLAQFYRQYEAFQDARAAARFSLEQNMATIRHGGITGLFFLQLRIAITDWGNGVSSEAQSLTQYNTELATLQEQMGIILEEHGIRFIEEDFCSVGPLGRLAEGRWYPMDRRPGPNQDVYQDSPEPAERVFNLEDPAVFDEGIPARAPRENRLPEALRGNPPIQPPFVPGPPVDFPTLPLEQIPVPRPQAPLR